MNPWIAAPALLIMPAIYFLLRERAPPVYPLRKVKRYHKSPNFKR